jgi:hypothetical protein
MDAHSHHESMHFIGSRVGWDPLPALHVAATDRGTWRVSASPDGPGTEHADQAAALQAARRACRRQWEHTGEPCLLRVHETDGTERVLPGFRDLA